MFLDSFLSSSLHAGRRLPQCLWLLIAFWISGCATSVSRPAPIAEFDDLAGEKWPAISIFSTQPSEELSEKCSEFDGRSPLHVCKTQFYKVGQLAKPLRATNQFQAVELANEQIPYQLVLSSAAFNFDDAKSLGNAVIAGASLLLIPLSSSATTEVTAQLAWNSQLLKTYSYEIPIVIKAGLLGNNADAVMENYSAALSSYIVRDIQADDAMSGQFLAKQLGATDYGANLRYPDSVGQFKLVELTHFPHPVAGAQLQYRDPSISGDELDVFVYPVRSVGLEQVDELLDAEIKSLKAEMEISQRENNFVAPEFNEMQSITWSFGGKQNKGRLLRTTLSSGSIDSVMNESYLFIVKDKFVLTRAILPLAGRPPNIEPMAREIMQRLDVPGESLFMAKVRQSERASRMR